MYQQPLKCSPGELRVKLEALGCVVSEEYSLASSPGSIHWHIKKVDERRGTLEATWLKDGDAWLCYHSNRHQQWVSDVLNALL